MSKLVKMATDDELRPSDVLLESAMNKMLPFAGNATSIKSDDSTKKKVISILLGRQGRAGMDAKRTGKSKLGEAAKSGAVSGSVSGGAIGAFQGARYFGRKGALGLGVLGSALGAAVGAGGGSLKYGIGYLAGDSKKQTKKRLKSK